MPTLEVLLRASSVVVLSSESAAPVTAPGNNGVQSAAASANQEELVRAERRIWGDDLDAFCPTMRMGIPPVSLSSPSGASGTAWRRTGPSPMALVLTRCHHTTSHGCQF